MSADKTYQLKVTLRHITPLIWRRLLVTSDTTIAQFHYILQTVMGWEDLHLHQFRVHGRIYGIYRDGGMLFDDDPHRVKLCDFKLRRGERFLYEYDLGNWWQHDIRLELILPLEPGKKYPVCTGGDCACQEQEKRTFHPLTAILPERTSPELLYLETKWASLASYGITSKLLHEVLPIDQKHSETTIRNHGSHVIPVVSPIGGGLRMRVVNPDHI